MFDCSKDLQAYHDDQVTLGQEEQGEMRNRRNANRTRLQKGLEKAGKPTPYEHVPLGSYATKTMTQHPDKNYDVDDGAYFNAKDLVGPRGGEMSALETRQMVRDALDDGSFNTPPALHTNCIRVQYNEGYQVDIPVYRRIVVSGEGTENEVAVIELASADWKQADDAREVTKKFEAENIRQSPDTTKGRQLRRVTRELKKFSKSRSSWPAQILGGFGITTLVLECYCKDVDREDKALYDTMKSTRDRLNLSLSIRHPVTSTDYITKEPDDPKARFFKDKLSDALDDLKPLFDADCDREKALKCWDKVFATDFFIKRLDKSDKKSESSAAITPSALRAVLTSVAKPDVVRKEGTGRFA